MIGEGKIAFWDDLWLGDSGLREHCLDERGADVSLVSDLIYNDKWDEPKLRILQDQAGIPHHIVDRILATPIISGEPDIPRWTLSRHGDFTLASSWETLRTHRPIIQGLDDIWKAGLTLSIAIFNWRLLSNRVPVDSKLQWRKIDLASKCECCPHRPNTESVQHLFIQGHGATRVWKEFDEWFEGPGPAIRINDTIPDRLEVWSKRIQQEDRKHLSRSMPYLIFWFLWAERNRSRHQQVQFKPYNVVWQVQMFIRNSMINGTIKPKHWRGVRLKISLPDGAETRRPRPLVIPVKWYPPDQPWIKVNTDGAFSEISGKSGGGGVVRDASGALILAFVTPLQAKSALEAELLAMHIGLELAKEFGKPIWIESDSEQAVKLASGASWGPAHVFQAVARLVVARRLHPSRVTFIPREGNKAADLLAKEGLESEALVRITSQNASRLLRAIIRLDGMGVPNIRIRDNGRD